jgi:uncharacterized membrane protein YfcA
VIPWRDLPSLAIPMVVGSLIGAYAAAYLDEALFRRIAAALFAAMLVTLFVDTPRWTTRHEGGRIRLRMYPIFFLMGIYGGFLQAGIGSLIITALVVLGGYDVVRGSALKFGLVLVFTLAAILVFTHARQIQWVTGLILAVGSMVGGSLGAKLVIARGTRWVRIFVILAALSAIAELLFGK